MSPILGGAVNIWVPFTELAPETAAFAGQVGAELAELSPDDAEDYGRFMAARWLEGAAFLVVEHDVVPTYLEAAELWACPEPLCFYHYADTDQRYLVFGCVKFSSGFIAAEPDLWERFAAAVDAPEGHRDHDFSATRCRRWMMLPEWLCHAVPTALPHWHGRVRHLARGAGLR